MKIFTQNLKFTLSACLICISLLAVAQVETQTQQVVPSQRIAVPVSVQSSAGISDDTIPQNQTLFNGVDNTISIQQSNSVTGLEQNTRTLFIKEPVQAYKSEPEISTDRSKAVVNDDICSATSIPAPLNGNCVTNQTNISATGDYYGGCVPINSPSVWYTFTLTGTNDQIDITFTVPGGLGAPSLGQGSNIFTFLMSGNCASPTGIYTLCQLAGTTFHFDHLTAGVTYYLEVATSAATTGNFNICATQSVMPVGSQTGPEQNCDGAIPLCSGTYSYLGSYFGDGGIDEVSHSTCLSAGETNSIWYVFTCQTAGTFGFNIVTANDYDFALYDLTAIGGCAFVPSATPIRCNFSATYGNTGLTVPPTSNELPALSVGAGGAPTMNGITNLTAGNTYALIVDNWTGDNNGFTINFLGTASIMDVTKPTMTSIAPSCVAPTILLTMSEPIQCLSVQQNDFQLRFDPAGVNTDVTAKITQILGFGCPVTSGALSTQIQITHDGTLATGHYRLVINPNPSLADKCGNIILAGSWIEFDYLADITLTATPSAICAGATISLNADGADGAGVTYTLNPGGATNNTNGVFGPLSPLITTNYIVSATFGGCSKNASATVTVEGNIITTISPGTTTVCNWLTPVILTATTTINGVACVGCTYVWSTGATTSSISVGSPGGTFTVTATTPTGCHNSNSPSTTLSLASGGTGGGSCDVIYVSPAGGGTGLTKASPTTLANAITMAECTYTTIKMQKGIYNLTDYQVVHSYVTIEGGYDVGFTTKSSDLTGAANSTTIRRRNFADSDNPNTCTAFRVDAGASAFRIQDIRIELPGSTFVGGHVAGSNKTNYGINLGAGCTGYNIIRCYIDAGVGSNP
jgi:hypothetical protein